MTDTKTPEQLMKETAVNLEVIANDIGYIKRDVGEIKDSLKNDYVTREEFTPIKNLVFGTVGLILTAVIVAIVALVIK